MTAGPIERCLHSWSRTVVVHACKVFWLSLLVVLGVAGAGVGLLVGGGTEIDGGTSKFVVQGTEVAQRQMAQSAKPTGRRDSKLGPLQVLSAKLGPVRTPMEAAKAAKESGLTVDAYLGGWTDDTRSGLGRLTTSAGEIYEGEWSGGRRHAKVLAAPSTVTTRLRPRSTRSTLQDWSSTCIAVVEPRPPRHSE